ncbi:hypothetical protein TWF281_002259 [Arthrobotrys megalospora]
MRALSGDYVLINRRDAIISSLNHDSEFVTKNRRPAPYGSLSTPHRYIPTPGLMVKRTLPIKKETNEISTDDSMFNLLEHIEDQITDFQAEFAKLKRAYRRPTSPSSSLSHSARARQSGSALLSRLEAEILDLRDHLEHKTYRGSLIVSHGHQGGNVVPKMDAKSADTDIISHASTAMINRPKPELISIPESCELLVGIIGFLYIAVPLLHGLAKLSLFMFLLISPFHKLS